MAFVLEKIHPIRNRRRSRRECPAIPCGERLIREAAALVRRGNLSRIVVRSRNSVVLDTSVTATVLAAVASPRLTLLGMAAVLLSTWDVEIEKPQDLL
ncbi:MAG: DUF4342 domain-containing protein [Bacillota bacterium]|jgi:hypothetical protein